LVLLTRYRKKIFDADPLDRLKTIFDKVCRDFEGLLAEMHGEVDQVHLLVNYPPKHSVSSLVNSLKGVSSRLLRLQRPDIEKKYWKGVLWSPSYFAASCSGAPISILKEYIEQQKTPL
jgi:putative transposase